jgi:hypothetical protein
VPRDAGGAFDTDQECPRASCLNPASARGEGRSSITQDQRMDEAQCGFWSRKNYNLIGIAEILAKREEAIASRCPRQHSHKHLIRSFFTRPRPCEREPVSAYQLARTPNLLAYVPWLSVHRLRHVCKALTSANRSWNFTGARTRSAAMKVFEMLFERFER